MVVIDQWFKSAIVDNTIVAQLLLSLKHSYNPFFSHWGAKKPRSSLSRSKNHLSSTAFSPTTPLSWTASADASQHSNHHIRSKTFSELSEEESSLIKERIYLTKDIENKKATFVAQIVGNGTLKRRKLDLGSISCDKPNSSNEGHYVDAHLRATRIVIPDLNMMPPSEEDSYNNFPYGMS
ncbi:hypothetical protein Lalb_Chr22g0361441 [Lupinus albus]|uniref:Uncharacterized protein n=1 Tax=Lupinus albus TaxID=3870 RepID=A0A6A4NN34_LUPAL|nr:hypothetical protein Lalb_Chr22g0361441 [Lupinus albus]